ncbi:MAG: ATP-binding protein [Patescibacteria group bacterium]
MNKTSVQENDFFDLKEGLPHPNDTHGKDRLKKEFCAFANCGGGFLFFGVRDDRTAVGLDEDREFTTRTSQIISRHIFPPTINWKLYETIRVGRRRRYIYIIKIEESSYFQKPHIFYKEGDGLVIPVRRNGHLDFIKDGRDIRELVLLDKKFYPEYRTHAKKIIEGMKNSTSVNLSLLEAVIIQELKSFIRENFSNITGAGNLLDSIFTVEQAANQLNQAFGVSAFNNGADYQNARRILDQSVDKCLSELSKLS